MSNIVIFSDSKSVLQALQYDKYNNSSNISLALSLNSLMNTFAINISLQWIPGHCNIAGNERADTLAKRGAACQQPDLPTSQQTAKQIIKSNNKVECLNEWAMGKTGRAIFPYMTRPNPKDPIENLKRGEQSIIFRLRTQHVPLNAHLNRIKPEIPPLCLLCDVPLL